VGDVVMTRGVGLPVFPKDCAGDPLMTLRWTKSASTFHQTDPVEVSGSDFWTPAVLSGRPFIWLEENKWWTQEEYAAIMDYPPEMARRVADEMGHWIGMQMLSKGVSPFASRWVQKHILEKSGGGAVEYDQDMYGVECSRVGGPKRKGVARDEFPYNT